MANPQKENGHIDIANEIAEVLAKTNFRPYESRTLWALWRKTWGWHKKEDNISLTQFQKLTGLERRHQRKALKTLIEKNIITYNRDSYIVSYGFQKNYHLWKVVPKQAPVSGISSSAYLSTTPVPKQAPEVVPKQAPTKENKETIQKKGETDKTDNIQDGKALLTQATEELGRMAKVEDIVKWLKKLPHQHLRNQLRFFLISRYPQDADRAWGQAEVIYKREQTL